MANQNSNESAPKETSPNISAGQPTEVDKLTRRYDLVEQMQFLFVRVIRGRDIHNNTSDLYVEIKLGNLKATTRFFDEKKSYPEWNQVFAFEKDKIQDLNVEVLIKNNVEGVDMSHAFLGRVRFSLSDVPKRVPPEPSLAPQWYKLEDQNGTQLVRGDIMLSLWMGTQADEYFPHAWCSDATSMSGDAVGYTRSKVYISPTLWYLRVNVIQAQNLLLRLNPEIVDSDIFVQVFLGSLSLRTVSKNKSANPLWNEDLMFVAQEPFNDTLILSVEQGTLAEHVSLGRYELPLKDVDKRLDGGSVAGRWYNLDRPGIIETAKEVKFASKLNARISLDGAYHVMDEPTEYSSDFRPSAKKLWRSSIGILELGILKATGLVPMKMEARTDAYCVAKYGPKWVRTRTVVDCLSPNWNEQYIWEVFEPFTVITIAVFDNNQLDANSRATGTKDAVMGKIRIRLSTLERGKVYAHSYPLIGLQPSGVKKMGEIHLAVRFSWPFLSSLSMFQLYKEPLLPRHHQVFPLSPAQFDNLRSQAANIIALRLSRAEPPLGKEVVNYMLDMRSDMWSMRKGRANVDRVMSLFGGFVAFWKWLEDIRYWKNPVTTLLFHFQCILMLLYPEPILPFVNFYIFYIGLKRYFKRPRRPCHIDAKLYGADTATPEDLEEELDPCPTQLEGEPLRRRYDRLRNIARSTQRMANDLATIGERLQSLSSWRDKRATLIFLLFCSIGFLVTVTVPAQVTIFLWITFYLRHPRFRSILPSIPENFLKRMPSKRAFIL